MKEIRAVLACGTPVVVRPIRPADGVSLLRGLERLSPQGNVHRFLHHRKTFTERELHYLTHCDNVDHFAKILAILDSKGAEIDAVGVARFIREPRDPELAEVAIVLVDEWQGRGAGTLLLGALAAEAWDAGIRRWHGMIFEDNIASRRLLSKFGHLVAVRGRGVPDETYALHPRPLGPDVGSDAHG